MEKKLKFCCHKFCSGELWKFSCSAERASASVISCIPKICESGAAALGVRSRRRRKGRSAAAAAGAALRDENGSRLTQGIGLRPRPRRWAVAAVGLALRRRPLTPPPVREQAAPRRRGGRATRRAAVGPSPSPRSHVPPARSLSACRPRSARTSPRPSCWPPPSSLLPPRPLPPPQVQTRDPLPNFVSWYEKFGFMA